MMDIYHKPPSPRWIVIQYYNEWTKKRITSVVYLIPQVSACSLLLLRTKSMCLEKYEQSENRKQNFYVFR